MTPVMMLIALAKIVVILFLLLTMVAYTVWFERKLVAGMQSRWGPTRVGPHGLLQPLADSIKLLMKEDLTPGGASRLVYLLSPFLALVTALLAFAVIPFGPETRVGGVDLFQIADPGVGILFILAVSSMGIYGIALAGWSSNSKYSLLGSLRSSAQMVSYELAIGISIIGVLLLTGSLSLRDIVNNQAGYHWGLIPRWNIFPQFIGFFCFLTAAFAKTNRLPFDMPEAETELVGGVSYRVQQHEVRHVLPGRVHEHGRRVVHRDAAVLRRMARSSVRAGDSGNRAAAVLVRNQSVLFPVSLRLDPRGRFRGSGMTN